MTAFVLALATVAITAVPATIAPQTAAAAPGNPGVPSDPTQAWQEDFENGTNNTPSKLAAYTGTGGRTYSADPFWINYRQCNGVIVDYLSRLPVTPGFPNFPNGLCDGAPGSNTNYYAQMNVRRMADVLGQVAAGVPGGTPTSPANESSASTQRNHAITAWTSTVNGPTNATNFQTNSDIDLGATTTRFYTTSVDVAEASCDYQGGVNNSKLDFFLVIGGTTQPINASPIQLCQAAVAGSYTSPVPNYAQTDPYPWYAGGDSIKGGRVYSDNATKLTAAQAASVGLRMVNETGSSQGNDFSFDNITLYDATPQLDKSFSPASIPQGGTSNLTFTITNTSELGAKNGWSFTDALPSGVVLASQAGVTASTCGSATVTGTTGSNSVTVGGNIAAGQTSCTVTVRVTSPTVGSYTNGPTNVTTSGLNPPGPATLTVTPVVGLSITKTANLASYAAGQPLTYSVTVKNAASTAAAPISTATGAAVTDPFPSGFTGASWTCAPSTGASCHPGSGGSLSDTVTLPAGGQIVYTITGAVAGGTTGNLVNKATVVPPSNYTDPNCPPAPGAGCSATATLPGSSISITKTPSRTSITAPGQVVTYTFGVTNTGQSTLTNVGVTDVFTQGGTGTTGTIACTGLTGPTGTCTGNAVTLTAGRSATFTGTYTTTQADIDAGGIKNTGTVTGTPPSGPNVTAKAAATVSATPAAGLTITKSATPARVSSVGSMISYSFLVRNSGNVTLNSIAVADTQTAPASQANLSAISCPATTLVPNATTTCTATYSVTQADISNGSINDSATASGETVDGTPVTSNVSSASVPTVQTPSITLVKSSTTAAITTVGQVVPYSFRVTNSGNVPLTAITVADTQTPPADPGNLSAVTCPSTSLDPGLSTTCTANYTVTQADLNNGSVNDSATASGTPPSGPAITSTPSTLSIPATQTKSLTLTKSATPANVSSVGAAINYSFLVRNTGNVTLTGISVDDAQTAPATQANLSAISCPVTTLAPNLTTTCTATYPVTQADLNNGSVNDSATASGTPPTVRP